MNDFNISQQRALAIIPMFSGSLSLFGSGLITFMIFKSKKKISTPFRRIILGLSVSDISVSLAYVCSTLPAIKGSSWNSQGNQTTCNIQGIFFLIGIVGVPFYILALTSYYLCVAKYALSDQVIARKVEPFFHITGVLWVTTSSIYFLLAGSLSSGVSMCWIKKEEYLERWIFVGGPVLLCFIGVCVNMFLIYRTAATQAKKTNKYTFQQYKKRASKVTSFEQPSPSNEGRTSISSILSPRALMHSFRRKSSLNPARGNKERQVMIQALFYVSAFFISFIWSYIIIIYENKTGTKSFVLSVLSRLFQPMLGFSNVLIYTRYHVASVRSMYIEKNWFQAFFFAVKSAGDNEEFREETAQVRLIRRIEKRNSLKSINLITTGQETSTDMSNGQHSGPPSLEVMVKFPLQTDYNSKKGEESQIGDLEKGDDPLPKNDYNNLMREVEYTSEEEKCEEGLDPLPQDYIRYSNVDANEDDEEIIHDNLEDDLSVDWKGQEI